MPENPATPADPNLSPSGDPLPGDQVSFDNTEHVGTGGDNTPADPAGIQGPGDVDPDLPVSPTAVDTHDGGEHGPSTTDMTGSIFTQVSPGTLPDDADNNLAGAGAAGDPYHNNAPAPDKDPETPSSSGGSNTPNWGGEGAPSSAV